MKPQRFHAILLAGQKESAVEVPFDPAQVWSLATKQLGPGRWGHEVEGTVNGVSFQGIVASRSGRYLLLLDAELVRAAGLSANGPALVVLKPRGSPAPRAGRPPAPRRRAKERP